MFMRKMVYNFMNVHSDKKINGLTISDILSSQGLLLSSYLEQDVIEDKKDAQNVILAILPIALRIAINIHIVNTNDVIACEIIYLGYSLLSRRLSLLFG